MALSIPRLFARRVVAKSTTVSTTRAFSTNWRLFDSKVIEVVSYGQSNRRQETLTVDKSTIVKAPPSDVSRPAMKYNQEDTAGLTPTLKNFTLENKVAVITGYVKTIQTLNSY